jgi:hypothetical protein
MDIDRDEGLSMTQYPLLLPPDQPTSNRPAILLYPSGQLGLQFHVELTIPLWITLFEWAGMLLMPSAMKG